MKERLKVAKLEADTTFEGKRWRMSIACTESWRTIYQGTRKS